VFNDTNSQILIIGLFTPFKLKKEHAYVVEKFPTKQIKLREFVRNHHRPIFFN